MSCKTCKIELDDLIYKNCESCRVKKREAKQRYLERHPEQIDKKNEWSKMRMRERRTTSEFRQKEAMYLEEYCKKKCLTYQELWKDIAEKREKEFGEFLKTATLDDAVKSKYFNDTYIRMKTDSHST